MKAIVAEFARTGIEEAEFGKLCEHHLSLCLLEGTDQLFVNQFSIMYTSK